MIAAAFRSVSMVASGSNTAAASPGVAGVLADMAVWKFIHTCTPHTFSDARDILRFSPATASMPACCSPRDCCLCAATHSVHSQQ